MTKCGRHERIWRGRCVDRNLEDEWLERLNGLHRFELVSICEGHADRRVDDAPTITLRLRPEAAASLLDAWTALRRVFRRRLAETFAGLPGSARFEIRETLFADAPENSSRRITATLFLGSAKKRTTRAMDRATERWFEDAIERCRALDGSPAT
jgi:hypothetical protein